jgi:hypothetical protein
MAFRPRFPDGSARFFVPSSPAFGKRIRALERIIGRAVSDPHAGLEPRMRRTASILAGSPPPTRSTPRDSRQRDSASQRMNFANNACLFAVAARCFHCRSARVFRRCSIASTTTL